MNYLFDFFSIFFLIIIVIQDFRNRKISLSVLLLWLGISLVTVFIKYSAKEVGFNILMNSSFVILVFILLAVYFSIKEKKVVNILDRYIGLGDFVFFLFLGISFSPANYFFFFTIGLLFTLIVVISIRLLYPKNFYNIPLAGAFAIQFICLLLVQYFISGIDLYSDAWIYNLIAY